MGLFDKKKADVSDSVYATVTTNEIINEMVGTGQLKAVYLMPLIFNGQASEKNTIYVPPFVFDIKEKSDIMIEELLMKNIVNNYVCTPTYVGDSKVPVRLEIVGKKSGNVVITQNVNIW